MVLLQFYNFFCQVPILIVKENGDHTQGLGQLVDLVFCPQNPYLKASTGKTETNISETLLANQQAHLVSYRPRRDPALKYKAVVREAAQSVKCLP